MYSPPQAYFAHRRAQRRRLASAPVNVASPSIVGPPTEGQTLTRVVGEWSGFPAPILTGVWLAGDVAVGVGASLLLTAGMVGAEITYSETATNAFGADVVVSDSVGPVEALDP
jgi:hypothetical protein